MALSIQRFVMEFSTVPLVAACVVGVLRYRRLGGTLRYLVWLSLLALLVTVGSLVLVHYKRPNLMLAPVDTAIEFTLLALMYRRSLQPSALTRYLPWAIGAFLGLSALSLWQALHVVGFSPVQHTVESVALLALVGVYLRGLLQPPVSLAPLEREPMFWVSAGLLLYFSGNLLIFLTSNAVLHLSRDISHSVWAIHALLYSFLNCFYVVALSVTPRPVPAAEGEPGGVTQS